MASITGHNSVINLQKLTHNNANLDLVNINAYAKFGQISLTCSRDIGGRGCIMRKDCFYGITDFPTKQFWCFPKQTD